MGWAAAMAAHSFVASAVTGVRVLVTAVTWLDWLLSRLFSVEVSELREFTWFSMLERSEAAC